MTRLWLVGEAPGRTGDPLDPLAGRPLARIAALSGLAEATVRRRVVRCNLIQEWPGHQGKGSAFPRAEAEGMARDLCARVEAGDMVIVLGMRAWSAFPYFHLPARPALGETARRVRPVRYLEWMELERTDDGFTATLEPGRPSTVEPLHRVVPFLLAVMPHPSGINHWWNGPSNERAARRFLRHALRQGTG